MDNLNEFYRAYGLSLATRLAPFMEPVQVMPFVFVDEMDNPVEILSYTSSGKPPEGLPVLVWDNFEESIDTGGRDNYHLPVQGSLSVLMKAKDQSAKHTVRQRCRQLVLKAFAMMLADAADGALEQEGIQLDVRQVPLEKVGPVSIQWYGYGLQFSWHVPLDLTL